MDVFRNKDIVCAVQRFLPYIDQVALSFTCRWLHQIGTISFIRVIWGKLSKHVHNPVEFCQKLKETGSVISGSFILSCLYDDAKYSDIDIYESVNCKYRHEDIYEIEGFHFNKWLYEKQYTNINPGGNTFEGPIYMIREYAHLQNYNWYVKPRYPKQVQTAYVNYIRKCVEKNNIKPIQYIAIRKMPIREFIEFGFDMDICKNIFDGEKLFVKSWNMLFKKKSYILPKSVLMSFYGINKDKERMQKYLYKGFDVKLHPNYHKMQKIIFDSQVDLMIEDYGYSKDDVDIEIDNNTIICLASKKDRKYPEMPPLQGCYRANYNKIVKHMKSNGSYEKIIKLSKLRR